MQSKILQGEGVLHTDIIIIFIIEDSLHPFLMTLLRLAAVLTFGAGEMCCFEKKISFENEMKCCLIFVLNEISNNFSHIESIRLCALRKHS